MWYKSITKFLCVCLMVFCAVSVAAEYTMHITYIGERTLFFSNDGSNFEITDCNVNHDTCTFAFESADPSSKLYFGSREGDLLNPEITPTITEAFQGKNAIWIYADSSGVIELQQEPKNVTIRFMPFWTNTSALLYIGSKKYTMTAVPNYCGWFEYEMMSRPKGFEVEFHQTIGDAIVGGDGVFRDGEKPTRGVNLDSVVAISDTVYIRAYPNGEPSIFAEHPGVLGECPIKKLSVMVFDWKDGNASQKCSKDNKPDLTTDECGSGTSLDFGNWGCNNEPATLGMVEETLGPRKVPIRSSNFPSNCTNAEHLNYWFIAEDIATGPDGKVYTNATCRDITLELDKKGFWVAQKDDESPEGGFFVLDDFQYLDSAKTIPNPYYDQVDGNKDENGNKIHNFGFSMKIQAKFEYIPGQEFTFNGDDDVWVFINNRLVVDIGGQHHKTEKTVKLDTLGLVKGETYPFHIFYAERMRTQSNFKMRTSIDLHTDASMFLTGDSTTRVKYYDIWQINKKDVLSCDFDAQNVQVDTVPGVSMFRLTGGNLPASGVNLDEAKVWYEGITIDPSFTKFSIDTAAIAENYALAPGHYYLEVTLRDDITQTAGVWINIPMYKVPSIAYAREDWSIIGTEVDGDTLQIGTWAYVNYPVNIAFAEDWAQVSVYNRNIEVYSPDTNIIIMDSTGKKTNKVVLDSLGHGTFMIMASSPIDSEKGATLELKGSATTTAKWVHLRFAEPPVPRISEARFFDRNGDGRGDSIFIHFNKALGGDNNLDSLTFSFGEHFPVFDKYTVAENKTDVILVSSDECLPYKNCGFGTQRFTGKSEGVYKGTVKTWFAYYDKKDTLHFTIPNDPLEDGVNPFVVSAVKDITSDGHILTLTFSEAVDNPSIMENFTEAFRYFCVRDGDRVDPELPASVHFTARNKIEMLFLVPTLDAIIPSVGDSVGFVPGDKSLNVAKDLSENKPHQYSPMVRITGKQDMSITSAGVLTLDPNNPLMAEGSPTTVPHLIVYPDQKVDNIADSLGVHGHLFKFDVSELLKNETTEQINNLDAFIINQTTKDGVDTTYTVTEISKDSALVLTFKDISDGLLGEVYGFSSDFITGVATGEITLENYASKISSSDMAALDASVQVHIEASRDTVMEFSSVVGKTQADVFKEIMDGVYSEKELKEAGISQDVIEAIKKGDLTNENIDQYRSGSMTIVTPDDVMMTYETHYYSHLGHYVGGSSGTITCADSIYNGNCLENAGNIFLSWNMRSDDGRMAGTGVYIARLEIKVKVGKRMVDHVTRDLLWGIRRKLK